jgi:outer membrane receptor protein involved in Fe transport
LSVKVGIAIMRSILILVFRAFLTMPAAFAGTDGGAISGTVADAKGAVIPGVTIEATNNETGALYKAVSTETGNYTIASLPAGVYDLSVVVRGFRRFQAMGTTVGASQSVGVDIVLEVDTIRETVTVNAGAPLQLLDHPQAEPPALQASISAVDRFQIEKQGAKTVMDALNYVPGSWTETRGRKEKQLYSVRGQRYPYPEYSINGALFREFYEVPYFLSAEDIERIEILRSSATLLSGISGLAGVIDITPRKYDRRETTWLAEYGSLDSYRLHLSHGQRVGKLSYGLGFGGSHTDGPENRRGAERMLNLFGNADWKPLNSLSIQGTVLYGEGKRELVQAVAPAANQYRTAIQSFDPVREVSTSVKVLYKPTGRLSSQFTFGYSNRHNTYVATTGTTTQKTRDYDHEWDLNFIQSVALSESNVLRIGGNYNHWIAPFGKRFYSGRRSDLETYSVSVVDEHRFGRLLLDGGLRYQRTYINEYGAYNIDGTSTMFTRVPSIVNQWEPAQLSGSLGATYFLTEKISLRGNFLTGTVEPRRGTLTVDLEEPEKEHKTMVDAGLHLVRDQIGEFSLTGFYIKQKNAIALSGTTRTVNGRIMELYVNRDQDSKGLEFEFKSRPIFDNISLFFNATAMDSRARLQESMTRDAETPRFIMGGGILGKKRAFDYNLYWKFISAYESARFASSAVPQPLGDFHSLNANVGYSFGKRERIRIYFEVTNLTDDRFSTVVGYPDYGRRFQVGIRQTF